MAHHERASTDASFAELLIDESVDPLTVEGTRRWWSRSERRSAIVIALTACAMTGDDEKPFAACRDECRPKPIAAAAPPRAVLGYLAQCVGRGV